MKAAIALGALLLAFGPPALATDGVTSLVKGFDAEYDKAWNTLDAHKLAEEFSEDAVVLPPTRPAATRTGAVLAFFEPLFKSKWADHKLEPITAQRSGENIIVAASRWTANLTDAAARSRAITAMLLRSSRERTVVGSSSSPVGTCCRTQSEWLAA